MATKLSDIDFSTTTALAIPEGNVIKITKNGDIVWQMALYTWAKYSVNSTTTYEEYLGDSTSFTFAVTDGLDCSYSYTFDSATGTFTLTDPKSTGGQIYSSDYRLGRIYFEYPRSSGNVYKATSQSGNTYTCLPLLAKTNATQSRGDFIKNVTATDESTYPENGVHTDGYWYVKVSDTTTT